MHMCQQIARIFHNPADVAAHMERMGSAIEKGDVCRVDAANHVDRCLAVLDEVVRMRLQTQLHTLSFEDGQEFFHRSPELRLTAAGKLGSSVELRIHDVAVKVYRYLNGALPVADGGLPLILIGSRPAVQRQMSRKRYSRTSQGRLELAHRAVISPRVKEEWGEVLTRRKLDVFVAEIRDDPRQVKQRNFTEHIWVQCQLHLATSRSSEQKLRLTFGRLPPASPLPRRRLAWHRRRRDGMPRSLQLRCRSA